MQKIIKKYIKKYLNEFKNIKFRKKLKAEKQKLYIKYHQTENKFKSTRNKFKLLKTKLEFENTFQTIKKVNFYYYILWLLLIFSSWYILFFSDYFSIKTIDVIRNDSWVNINLVYKSVEDVRYTPIIFADKKAIEDKIMSYQPNINSITINKILPNNLKIVLWSYKEIFYFENENKKFLALENWSVIPTPSVDKKDVVEIKWLWTIWILDYKVIFNPLHLKRIKEAIDSVKTKNSFVKIKQLTYYKKEWELHIKTDDDIIIIFDLTKQINVQIEKLNIFYKKYQNVIKAWVIYVDLRINEKLIYCTKETQNSCLENLKEIYE